MLADGPAVAFMPKAAGQQNGEALMNEQNLKYSARSVLADIIRRNLPGEGWSLRSTAKKIGLDPGHLSRIFSGRRKLCLDTAMAICVALNLGDKDTEELIFCAAGAEAAETISKLRQRVAASHLLNDRVTRNVIERIDAATIFSGDEKEISQP
jgi:transcriptional regulator with XRE-family HTH domain